MMDVTSYTLEGVDFDESVVIGYIRGYYREAFNQLPSSQIPRVLKAGFCFGFLDPVSNIITNTAAASLPPVEEEANREKCGNKRKRSSQAGTSGSKAKGKKKKTGRIAARSLRGLVTFLTSYFRYLTTGEALRYLRLAKADLLVAVHLIEEDRDSNAFTIHLFTTKVAIICAAISAMRPNEFRPALPANHPKVTDLVQRSLTLASRLDEVSPLLAKQGLSTSTLRRLSEISMQGMHGTADPRDPMRHAVSRFPVFLPCMKMPVPFDLEVALVEVLLDRIHGYYLEAISRIPAPCLRSCHHRGLLKAGHCYGPFDPVTNIILSTIWYDTTFPPCREFEVAMICDKSLTTTECRSFHGLVTFVKELFPALSSYDITRYLLLESARLDRVISRAIREGHHISSISRSDAYMAAARAAHHPNPTALGNLATMLLPEHEEKFKSLLEVKHVLSPDDIRTISSTLSQNDQPRKPVVQKLISRAKKMVSVEQMEFEAHQSSIHKRVQGALEKYAYNKGVEYQLLAICGVNAQVPKDGNYADFDHYDGYPYSHINVWVRRKGLSQDDDAPTLLFIQCSNDSEDNEDIPLCLPVSESSKDAGRCFHCECEGVKIVHPSSATYLGQSSDFVDMVSGEHSMSNEELIGFWGRKTLFLDLSKENCIYFDSAWDVDFAARLNRVAKRQEEHGWKHTLEESNKITQMLESMGFLS